MKKFQSHNTRSGQSGKRLKGDPVLRYRIQQWIPLITILIIAGFAWVIHRLRSFSNIAGDPCVAASELIRLLNISGVIAASLLGFVALLLFSFSVTSLYQGVYPPSTMPIVRDTVLRTGTAARARAGLLAAIGVMVMSAAVYGYWRVLHLVSSLQAGC